MGRKTKAENGKNKPGRKTACRSKGTGTLEKHGRCWRAIWVVDGKRFMRSTGKSDRDEAEKLLNEWVAPYRLKQQAGKDAKAAKDARGVGLDVTAATLSTIAKGKRAEAGRLAVPLSKAWETFNASLSRKAVSKAVNQTYEGRWDAFLAWMEKNRPGVSGVADVDKETAEDFMRSIKAKFSPKTFNDYRALFVMMWRVLDAEAGLDGFNPWKEIATLDKETHTRRELTAEELMRVVEPLTGEMRVLFAIGIYTGLRMGDAVNLTWGAVDLMRGFIQWKPSKTKKHGTIVRIPLFPALAAILAETPARERRGRILPELAEEYERSNRYTAARVKRVFEDAGIETQADTGRANPKNKRTTRKAVEVGFHSLRHTFVSLCANAGVPLHIVQAIVGHTNAAMTAHYFHVSDEALSGAVAGLPDVFTPPALPAYEGQEEAGEPAPASAGAYEAVPPEVAGVARMLVGCPPAVLAEAEKVIARLVKKGGAA